MATLPFSKVHALLQRSTTISHILQVHMQLITNSLFFNPLFPSRLFLSLCESTGLSCSQSLYADLVFSQIPRPNTFTWNTIIRLHAISSNPSRALLLFTQMRRNGIPTDSYTYPFVLKACGSMPGSKEGVTIHGETLKLGADVDLFVRNALISLYCRCGEILEARALFDEMHMRDAFSWAVLIDGYGKKLGDFGEPEEALRLFQRMLLEGMKPDKVSAVGVIKACGRLGALDQGHWVHSFLKKNKIMCDVVVQTALVDMYMKCGSLELARRLFESITERSVASWNVMIVGLGNTGHGTEVVELFYLMKREGVLMDDLTFLVYLQLVLMQA
ncbi:hypothetical protein J5N97_002811 [Dioscorea zingiberensis]|uniref:Pentatricopeptide repeat-containing protein n=1 Tax=Dioscorea zingiberensis TaxID=325984 RepID=A0A9D5D2V9_9LILI|nr:hypothetical protein J5N97_002811 [Dioscorea zingiberensis]